MAAEFKGDGLDSLRMFLEAKLQANDFGWIGNPPQYTRDLPDKHPDKVNDPQDLVRIWRSSLDKPGVGQVPLKGDAEAAKQ